MDKDNHSAAALIHQINSRDTAYINKQFRALNLNSEQGRVISYVARHPQCKQRDVAHFLNRQEASVTNLVKGLAKRDLLSREVPEDNERTKLLSLTEEGETMVVKIDAAFDRLQAFVDGTLKDDERTTLEQLLEKVNTVSFDD
ncbi:hypothetical protein AYR62_15055 [Secundilactobacillus paracollinoides]|uniref:HTH marR-type domain-containing protein n=1 Tax=Secundilactobacillus paracollinoides TaxID=240427 RepID=A0A1B2IW23_9LACO|nr:MarR family winged helix-turn-helix transcriptional regulator [Secundilactobacillus paracollinoides]ANZ60448.1 hypothetical protein AYR61_03215 [Secundilactobacillus paracollinoides]ANZ65266.1 hypothetical protein AYR62_15055 [Secundilactobacillus paracollinoides]ANZ66276.1 hypothetical protein AYR63_03420 [Secundilactobacillus paracollinoides]KRL77658.1 hypothetical protein FC17_GL001195 [Secundilactobacillus paracollinoides DSM 15502 = JCM 11969]